MAVQQRVSDIPAERLDALNSGEIEARTLTECLAVDFAELLPKVAPDIPARSKERMQDAAAQGITKRMALAAELLSDHFGPEAAERLGAHRSDTVRGWAAYCIGAWADLDLAAKIGAIAPFADDAHFGVREWSWLAIRPDIAAEISEAIRLLTSWTDAPSANLRRFATEATRPRGVWCAHIKALKRDPEPARPLLEPLRADPSQYVQDSVANWLNDASKDRPDWVRAICGEWVAEGASQETERIVKRAMRSLRKP